MHRYKVNVRQASSNKIFYVYRFATRDQAETFIDQFRSPTYVPELIVDVSYPKG